MSRMALHTLSCNCCGEQEKQSGCVRGLRCGCESRCQCSLCRHCIDHHHKNCTKAAREEMALLVGSLLERHKINIFEPGQKSDIKKGTSLGGYRLRWE